DSRNSSAMARRSAASETATATLASRLPSRLMTTCNVLKFSNDEIVNSPSTKATEISAADVRAPLMLGTTMRQITSNEEQPKLERYAHRIDQIGVVADLDPRIESPLAADAARGELKHRQQRQHKKQANGQEHDPAQHDLTGR